MRSSRRVLNARRSVTCIPLHECGAPPFHLYCGTKAQSCCKIETLWEINSTFTKPAGRTKTAGNQPQSLLHFWLWTDPSLMYFFTLDFSWLLSKHWLDTTPAVPAPPPKNTQWAFLTVWNNWHCSVWRGCVKVQFTEGTENLRQTTIRVWWYERVQRCSFSSVQKILQHPLLFLYWRRFNQ